MNAIPREILFHSRFPEMMLYADRLASFDSFPRNVKLDFCVMASGGLFHVYTPHLPECRDTTVCFVCGEHQIGWKDYENVMLSHSETTKCPLFCWLRDPSAPIHTQQKIIAPTISLIYRAYPGNERPEQYCWICYETEILMVDLEECNHCVCFECFRKNALKCHFCNI